MVMDPSQAEFIKSIRLRTILWCSITIPLSMCFWTFNLTSEYIERGKLNDSVVISPTRCLVSILLSVTFGFYGYFRLKSVNVNGASIGCILAFIVALSNYSFLAVLAVFVITASKATRVRKHIKRKFQAIYKEGGRNWVQVLCNCGMGGQLCILYLLDVGPSERPIDFVKDYRASWLSLGILGTFGAVIGDTWSSELGSVFSMSDPFLVTTLKRVPKGTNGGISVEGTILSILAGFTVGLSQYLAIYCFSDHIAWKYAPPQWPLIMFGALAGFLGSLIDSLFGATLQYTGYNNEGKIVNHSCLSIKHICGKEVLDNHSVNLLASVIMGLLLPTITKHLWP